MARDKKLYQLDAAFLRANRGGYRNLTGLLVLGGIGTGLWFLRKTCINQSRSQRFTEYQIPTAYRLKK